MVKAYFSQQCFELNKLKFLQQNLNPKLNNPAESLALKIICSNVSKSSTINNKNCIFGTEK
jgi:hypothetical protein